MAAFLLNQQLQKYLTAVVFFNASRFKKAFS